MRISRNIGKNFFKAVVIQLLLVSTLVIAAPPALSMAAPANDTGGRIVAAKSKDTTIKATGDQSNISGGSLPTPDADKDTLKTVLQIVFGIIGAFALLNITLSGLKYITSAGDAQKTSEAKNGIVYSLVGLMIAITAEAIVAFIVNRASVQ